MLQQRSTSNGIRIAVLGLIGTGFLIRLLWAGHFPKALYADSAWYYKQAVSLAQNQGYLYQGQPSAIWPVGYPFVLSLPYFGASRFHFGVLPVLVVFAVQPPIAATRWLRQRSANRRMQEQLPAQ